MAVKYTIAKGCAFVVADDRRVDVSEIVRIDRHRRGESSVSVAIVTAEGETIAEVGRYFHGCAMPYDFEDVSTFVEECEGKARAITADPYGRFLCYPEKFETDTDGTFALLTRLSR